MKFLKNMNSDSILNFQKLAFNQALYQTGSIDVAEDIASQTIYIYLLKQDMIVSNNLNGWIINTCKNYCKRYFEICKKEKDLKKRIERNFVEELETKIYQSTDFIDNEKDELSRAIKEVKESLSSVELKTYIFYLQCNRSFKDMQAISGESYSSLRQKISRINQKIKAETYKKMGVIATKKIVTPQLNDIIMKFLIRFKRNLEEGSLDKMYYYFSRKDLNNYNPCFNIVKVRDYEILLKESIYTIHVFFNNKEGNVDSFNFSFCVDKNHLKIVTPPTPPQKITMIELNSKDGQKIKELLKKNPEDKKGTHTISGEDLKILQQILMKEKKEK